MLCDYVEILTEGHGCTKDHFDLLKNFSFKFRKYTCMKRSQVQGNMPMDVVDVFCTRAEVMMTLAVLMLGSPSVAVKLMFQTSQIEP